MKDALYFLTQTIGNLVVLIFILRFWLPIFRVDFRNPISQSVLKFTSPIVNKARRFIPSFGQIDTSVILVTFSIQSLLIFMLLTISQNTVDFSLVLIAAIFELALSSANLFFLVIIINVLFSWIAPYTYSPFKSLVENIADSILSPYRKMFGSIGGLDLSPLFAIIAIQTIMIFLKSSTPLNV